MFHLYILIVMTKGNFWMAKCSYINALPQIDSLDLEDRYQAEFWIGTGEDFKEKHRNCWTMLPEECEPPGLNLYGCSVKEESYKGYISCRPQDQDKRGWKM